MSSLSLFRVNLTPSRNCRIDNIDKWLAAQQGEQREVGYQRITYNLTISLKGNQREVATATYNYLRLAQDNRIYYYFITDATWSSKSTITYSCIMDTINTYWNDFKWDDRTLITREHRNRDTIDCYDEGLHPALTRISEGVPITSGYNYSAYGRCYLVWLANGEINPTTQAATPIIPCACFEGGYVYQQAKAAPSNRSISFSGGVSYFISGANADGNITFKWGTPVIRCGFNRLKDGSDNEYLRAIRIEYTTGTTLTIYKLYYTGDTYPYAYSSTSTETLNYDSTALTISTTSGWIDHATYTTDSTYASTLTNLIQVDQLNTWTTNISLGNIPSRITTPFSSLDRSSTAISSILQVPYLPGSISGFISGFNLVRLDLDDGWGTNLTDTITLPSLPSTLAPHDKPNLSYESKLWSSEFYNRVYVYGDDQWTCRYELLNSNRTTLPITCTVSRNMTNDVRFTFNLNMNEVDDIYGRYLYTSPNTQVAQYNSSYIDYIRNGYNYDAWTTKRNNTIATVNAVISGISGVTSLAASVGSNIVGGITQVGAARNQLSAAWTRFNDWNDALAEAERSGRTYSTYFRNDNPTYKYNMEANRYLQDIEAAKFSVSQARTQQLNNIGGIGSLVIGQAGGAINSAINSALSIESNNRSYLNNVNSRAAASVTTTGGSSVDLRPYPYLMRYEKRPPLYITESLYRTFYYTGYAHPVMELPDFTSRYWFNYVQCTPYFRNSATSVYSNYLDEIEQRFQVGVTVYHEHDGEWDLEQQYENGELALYK